MNDVIEFYDSPKKPYIASVESSMVPTVGSFISIRGATYQVTGVTYAVDYSDKPMRERCMRACVDIKGPKS